MPVSLPDHSHNTYVPLLPDPSTFVAHYTKRQYITAIQESTVAGEAFQDLDQTVTEEHRALWLEQERTAHGNRLDDVAAMDIYMTELSTGKNWHGYRDANELTWFV